MLFREYRVHHAAPDAIVLQLPGNGGFGKLTVETLGGDPLAERMLTRLASRDQIRAVARHTRDAQQYRLLSIQLRELWSDVLTLPPPVSSLLLQLFRKHVLVGLGTTTLARLVKATPTRGAVFAIAGGLTAVAALENVTSADNNNNNSNNMVEVRLLNYDVNAGVANVTARSEVVERTPSDVTALQKLLCSIKVGSLVSGTVLLSCTDDQCAIVEIPCGESSIIGYYIYKWPGISAGKKAEPPVVGSSVSLTVEFVPEGVMLQEILPFLILSNHRVFPTIPIIRSVQLPNNSGGLIGNFPWRDRKRNHNHNPESESDDDDDDDDLNNENNEDEFGVSKDSTGAHKMRKRKIEEALDAYERSMENAVPSSPEEFQRLLLAGPNNSYLWTQWMAHHVALQQYEEARLVAEKALSTIGVRETQELLNIWVAYMNLENLHGTAESLASVFKRALQRASEPLIVYERLADIFAATRKPNQLLALCRTMVSKFRRERRTWERLALTLMEQQKSDQLRRVLRDMAEALRRDEYCVTIVRLASHEYRQGAAAGGRALFEGLLTKFPRRADVWAAFLDHEAGLLARRDPAALPTPAMRTLLERATATKFAPRVMQQLLTRHLAFERVYGTTAEVERVKARARSYVEAKMHAAFGETSDVIQHTPAVPQKE